MSQRVTIVAARRSLWGRLNKPSFLCRTNPRPRFRISSCRVTKMTNRCPPHQNLHPADSHRIIEWRSLLPCVALSERILDATLSAGVLGRRGTRADVTLSAQRSIMIQSGVGKLKNRGGEKRRVEAANWRNNLMSFWTSYSLEMLNLSSCSKLSNFPNRLTWDSTEHRTCSRSFALESEKWLGFLDFLELTEWWLRNIVG